MDLFISYAHKDVNQVKHVVEILRSGGYEPWFDHKLLPGQDWQAELLSVIKSSDAFVYCLSPDSVASKWCQWEFGEAVKIGKPIIPVLLEKCEVPEEIARFQYADFSGNAIRITATGLAIARLLGGLAHMPEFKVDVSSVFEVVAEPPSDTIPAQAIDNNITPNDRRDYSSLLPPDISWILPDPFEWCIIPAGWVTLSDTPDNQVSPGGKFYIKRFWMAKYPITNSQYQIFLNDEDGFLNVQWWDYSSDAQEWRKSNTTPVDVDDFEPDSPRVKVTWFEAMAFCRWLKAKTIGETSSINIMLPTEQQWQRAAQGERNWHYPWGNIFEKSNCNARGSGDLKPSPVTKYAHNASTFGIVDMSGNVEEWCLTKWGINSGLASYAIRGGSWLKDENEVKVTSRSSQYDFIGSIDSGFRVICVDDY